MSDIDDMPELEDDMDSDNDEAWEEADDQEAGASVVCLFCNEILEDPDKLFGHCSSVHDFHLTLFGLKHQLDCIGYIKLINFIRTKKPTVEAVNGEPVNQPGWDSDAYMMPHDSQDPLLQFDVETYLEASARTSSNGQTSNGAGDSQEMNEMSALAGQRRADRRVKELEEALRAAQADMASMRIAAQELVNSQSGEGAPRGQGAVADLSPGEDQPYFSSYAHFGIHQEMLQDTIRTESYRDLCGLNPEAFAGKTVLDVGCGTGILSMFAARAGAKQVFGVDMSDIVYHAMDIVRENGLDNKVEILKGKMEDLTLPVQKVDIIISEWMGYFLLFESMLDTIIWARKNYLAPGGKVYPDKCSMWLVGCADTRMYERDVTYWGDVYGFRMSCLRPEVVREAAVTVVSPRTLATAPAKILDLDVNSCEVADLQFSANFELLVTKVEPLVALVGYFDIGFEEGLGQKVHFTTGPSGIPTHWKQTVFLLEQPVVASKGTKLPGHVSVKKDPKDPRALSISILFAGKRRTYTMN